MPAASSEKILDSLPPEHQRRLRQIADEESVTAQVWIERVIMQRSEAGAGGLADAAAGEGMAIGDMHDGAAQAERPRSHHRAHEAHTSNDASIRDAGETVVKTEERTEVRRDDETDRPSAHETIRQTTHQTTRQGRFDTDISRYHLRLAERAAATEDVPPTIWMEQAILVHARRREDAARRPAVEPGPAAPAAVATTPVVAEATTGGRGLDLLVALILGAVLVLIILLILPWISFGRTASAATTPGGISSAATTSGSAAPASGTAPPGAAAGTPPSQAGSSAAPGRSAASSPTGGNVVVTTMINGAPTAQDATPRRRQPWPSPVRYRPDYAHTRDHYARARMYRPRTLSSPTHMPTSAPTPWTISCDCGAAADEAKALP